VNTQAIQSETTQRPYPLTSGPWIMTQAWHTLLFAHWPLPPAALRPLVPPALPLDTFEGQAWVGVVPFTMSDVSARFVPPLPWLSAFPEVNVRTYVTLDGRPGVYFFSLDATNPLAVWGARRVFHLPYYYARMAVSTSAAGVVAYASRRTHDKAPAELRLRYRPTGPASGPRPGTLAYFLTERYCLYTTHRERVYRCEIQHGQWPLQPAEAEIEANTLALAAGIQLPTLPPLLHYAALQEVLVWPPCRIAG
jgi:uncharacterized protein